MSDVHFGYKYCDHEAFQDFIINYVHKILKANDHLVLLGDIIDFWRSKNVEAVLQNIESWEQIFELVNKGV
ncbi:MAG: hypothetical protein MUO82_10035, partial [Candidatus Thermoplasmatota archaeon]|nr:hypothetical protein [Candidatus Thermoplasmatota archaeon]